MDTKDILYVMTEARQCSLTMFENASYIQQELVNACLSDDLRTQTTQLCSDFINTKYDIFSELSEIDDILDSPNPEPVVLSSYIERIVKWLSDDMSKMHELITALEDVSKLQPDYRLAYVLVAESATNILQAFNSVQAAVNRIQKDKK